MDFEELANQVGLDVLECVALEDGKPVTFLPNWRGSLAVFRLKEEQRLRTMTSPMQKEEVTWHSYLNRRIAILLFEGFSSGLPLFVLINTHSAVQSLVGQIRREYQDYRLVCADPCFALCVEIPVVAADGSLQLLAFWGVAEGGWH